MYQLFFFADVGKQLLECFLVLDETLKRDDTAEESDVARSRSPAGGGRRGRLTLLVPVLSLLSKLLLSTSNV